MALDFYPWEEGDVIKAEDLNALVQAIQDGTIFLNTTYISEQLATASARIASLESQVAYLESVGGLLSQREQIVLSAGQAFVGLERVPALDSEDAKINGLGLSKSGVPVGFVGDYSLSGSTLTFNPELASQIQAGDMFVIVYRYEA